MVSLKHVDTAENVAFTHLPAIAQIELGAQCRNYDGADQIPPFQRSVGYTYGPVGDTSRRHYGQRKPHVAFYLIANHKSQYSVYKAKLTKKV